MRVAILTSSPIGGAGASLPAIARAPGVEVACIILSRNEPPVGAQRRRLMLRRLRKVFRIGPLGALNGLRLRKWFVHSTLADIRHEAARLAIPIVEVANVNAPETVAALRTYRVELGVSLGNGYIASRVFATPVHGMINYHGELLPEYPGAQSIIWPIYFGKRQTGFTIHKIDKGIDTGAILLRRELDIAFRPTLLETVKATGEIVHAHMPAALAEVLANWPACSAAARPQQPRRHFTTPSLWQYLRMERNNRSIYRELQPGPAGGRQG